jgi:hypothetical protein
MMKQIEIAPIEQQIITWNDTLEWWDIVIPQQVELAVAGKLSDGGLCCHGDTQEEAYKELLSYAAGEYNTL